MPVDANLDYAYFMKNRDRLLKLIKFLKENLEVTDENVGLRSIQEKITRNGLGIRGTYFVSAMASLSPFIASMGGVDHFRTASLEMIANHRAMALYIIHYLKDVSEVPGKCPYFKCSLVSSEKLYRSIFGIRQDEKLLEEQSRAMQHILQSKNYYNDYFDLKKAPVDPTWNEEDVLNRVKEFIQQQISFEKKKKEKLLKKNNARTEGKDDQEDQRQEKKDQGALLQTQNSADRTPTAQNDEEAPAQNEGDAREDQAREVQEGKDDAPLGQPQEINKVPTVKEAPALFQERIQDPNSNKVTSQAAKEEERTLIDRLDPRVRSCSVVLSRVVQKEGNIWAQSQNQGQKAQERQTGSCTDNLAVQHSRYPKRKIKQPNRLNL